MFFSPNRLLFIFTTLALFFLLIFFHFKGMIFYDEGYILNAAVRIVHGQMPYRDFDMVYTPLSFLYTSGFLQLFGESVFSGRLAALTVSLLSLVALLSIVRLFTKSVFLQIISLFFFVSWGPTHTNFPWPVMFASCCLLYIILLYLKGVMQANNKYFFLVGIVTLLLFLAKQNFGIALFFVLFLSFLFGESKKKKEEISSYLLGTLSAISIFVFCLLITDSFLPFLQNLYIYTFERILVLHSLDTPFLYEGSILERILKFFFYTSPLTFSVF